MKTAPKPVRIFVVFMFFLYCFYVVLCCFMLFYVVSMLFLCCFYVVLMLFLCLSAYMHAYIRDFLKENKAKLVSIITFRNRYALRPDFAQIPP